MGKDQTNDCDVDPFQAVWFLVTPVERSGLAFGFGHRRSRVLTCSRVVYRYL